MSNENANQPAFSYHSKDEDRDMPGLREEIILEEVEKYLRRDACLENSSAEVNKAQGEDEGIDLIVVADPPNEYGFYWCLIKAHPINYGIRLYKLEYGVGEDGRVGFLSENDDFRITHWIRENINTESVARKLIAFPSPPDAGKEQEAEIWEQLLWDIQTIGVSECKSKYTLYKQNK